MRLLSKDYGHAFEVAFSLRDPWRLASMTMSKSERLLEVTFFFNFGKAQLCPFCGRELRDIFFSAKKQWHHLNFFHYETRMAASIPLFLCSNNSCVASEQREAILNTLFLDVLLMTSPYDSHYALSLLLGQHYR